MPYEYVDADGKRAVDPGTGTPVVPAPPQLETPQQRYDRLYPSTAAQQTPQVAVQTTTTPAQVPATATLPPEVLETLNSLKTELAALKEQKVTPAPEEVKIDPSKPPAWVQKIQVGDYEGAQVELAKVVEKTIQPRLTEVQNKAYQEAMSATQINLEIDRYVQKVRQDNPELAQFERYLQAPVATRIEEAKQQGKIKGPADFIREYKAAIDAEVTDLRNLGLVLRGQGKQEAQTRNQQVIASTTLVPNQVQSNQAPVETQETPDDSMESYFTRRRAQENRNHGMTL